MNKDSKKEIDLIEILKKIYSEKKVIIIATLFSTIIGIFYSLSKENIFIASSIFYPHYENNDNSLRNLAGIAGLNFNEPLSANVPITLYPKLLTSVPFKNKILEQEFELDNEIITYRKYLSEEKKKKSFNIVSTILSLPSKILDNKSKKNDIKSKQNNEYIMIDKKEYALQKKLNNLIMLKVNDKDGSISLSVRDKSPIVSAVIAQKSQEILQESIINFKLKNIKSVYDFTINQLNETKKSFYKLQDSLANFRDSNKNIKSDIFKNKLNRLESEYNIYNTLYNELAISKEKAAIEVQKNTPIFTIIKPVTIPIEKSEPIRSTIVIIYFILGIFLSVLYILSKDFINKIFRYLKNNF